MHELTVDSALSEQLGRLQVQTILCDSSGHALGFFSPLPVGTSLADLQLESPTPIGELQERRKQRTGKPLDEILARHGL
jgi:hypothetical protein